MQRTDPKSDKAASAVAVAMYQLRKALMDDIETGHMMADEAIVRLLNELGYDEVTAVYQKRTKWYA
jgi:hypothetical protein